MTSEQSKTVSRCKDMLKRAFPEMSGKIIFRLNHHLLGSRGIDVDMFLPNMRLATVEDEKVTKVKL